MNSLLPSKAYFRAYIQKFISLTVSVKMFIINMAAIFLYFGKITSDNFTTILVSIAGVKVVTDIVSIHKNINAVEEKSDE